MEIVFIIIAIITAIYFIWKKILLGKLAPTWKELGSIISENNKGADNINQAIEFFMIPDRISPHLFITNWNALADANHSMGINSKCSQSLQQFLIPFNRPSVYPLWFLAAYPDVASWVTQQATISLTFKETLTTEISKVISLLKNDERYLNHNQLRTLINMYTQKRRKLECSL
jgi:hypothetical protein